jgi:hypothetical protein
MTIILLFFVLKELLEVWELVTPTNYSLTFLKRAVSPSVQAQIVRNIGLTTSLIAAASTHDYKV